MFNWFHSTREKGGGIAPVLAAFDAAAAESSGGASASNGEHGDIGGRVDSSSAVCASETYDGDGSDRCENATGGAADDEKLTFDDKGADATAQAPRGSARLLLLLGRGVMRFLTPPSDWQFNTATLAWKCDTPGGECIRDPIQAARRFRWEKVETDVAVSCCDALQSLREYMTPTRSVTQKTRAAHLPVPLLLSFLKMGRQFIDMVTRIDWRFEVTGFSYQFVKKKDRRIAKQVETMTSDDFNWSNGELEIVVRTCEVIQHLETRSAEVLDVAKQEARAQRRRKRLKHSTSRRRRRASKVKASETAPRESSVTEECAESSIQQSGTTSDTTSGIGQENGCDIQRRRAKEKEEEEESPVTSPERTDNPRRRIMRRRRRTIKANCAAVERSVCGGAVEDDESPGAVVRPRVAAVSQRHAPAPASAPAPVRTGLGQVERTDEASHIRVKRLPDGSRQVHDSFRSSGEKHYGNGVPTDPGDSQASRIRLQEFENRDKLYSVSDREAKVLLNNPTSVELDSVLSRFRNIHFWDYKGQANQSLPAEVRGMRQTSTAAKSRFLPSGFERGARDESARYDPRYMSVEELKAEYRKNGS
jgi:hypothetical protein